MVEIRQSDDELVAAWRAGEEPAVRELTRRHNQRVYRVARSILRDDAEAEDAVQEAYVRAFTHLDTFRGDSAFGTWLVRIVINEALGRLKRARPVAVDVNLDELPALTERDNPERIMVQRELGRVLERSIDELPDGFREVFVARIVEGLSIEETADLFGLRPETVKTRVHRARVRLRHSLEGHLGAAVPKIFAFDGERCRRLTDAVVERLGREPRHPFRNPTVSQGRR